MAPKKTGSMLSGERFAKLGTQLKEGLPHLWPVLADEESFLGLNVKLMDDGTCLAIVKQYSSDGTPMVCFGGGYSYVGALMAVDAAIQGNRWRVDKPWQPGSK